MWVGGDLCTEAEGHWWRAPQQIKLRPDNWSEMSLLAEERRWGGKVRGHAPLAAPGAGDKGLLKSDRGSVSRDAQ